MKTFVKILSFWSIVIGSVLIISYIKNLNFSLAMLGLFIAIQGMSSLYFCRQVTEVEDVVIDGRPDCGCYHDNSPKEGNKIGK